VLSLESGLEFRACCILGFMDYFGLGFIMDLSPFNKQIFVVITSPREISFRCPLKQA